MSSELHVGGTCVPSLGVLCFITGQGAVPQISPLSSFMFPFVSEQPVRGIFEALEILSPTGLKVLSTPDDFCLH